MTYYGNPAAEMARRANTPALFPSLWPVGCFPKPPNWVELGMTRAAGGDEILNVFLTGSELEWSNIYGTHGPFPKQWGEIAQDGYIRFTAASKFAGCKEGKVFKLGVQGLGYYDDDGLSALALFWPWGGP